MSSSRHADCHPVELRQRSSCHGSCLRLSCQPCQPPRGSSRERPPPWELPQTPTEPAPAQPLPRRQPSRPPTPPCGQRQRAPAAQRKRSLRQPRTRYIGVDGSHRFGCPTGRSGRRSAVCWPSRSAGAAGGGVRALRQPLHGNRIRHRTRRPPAPTPKSCSGGLPPTRRCSRISNTATTSTARPRATSDG